MSKFYESLNQNLNQVLNQSLSFSQSFLLSKREGSGMPVQWPRPAPKTMDDIIKDHKYAFLYVLDFLNFNEKFNLHKCIVDLELKEHIYLIWK